MRKVVLLVIGLMVLFSLPHASALFCSDDWAVKRCFSTGADHNALDINYTFFSPPVDTTAFSDTNSAGFAMFDETSCAELDLNFIGANTDVNFIWRTPRTIPIDANDNDFCLYIGNNDRTTPAPRDLNKVYAFYDGWEGGSIDGTAPWTEGGSDGTVAIEGAVTKLGSYSLKITSGGGASSNEKYIDAPSGFAGNTADNNIFIEGWIRKSNVTGSSSSGCGSGPGPTNRTIAILHEGGNWNHRGDASTAIVASAADVWVRFRSQLQEDDLKGCTTLWNAAGVVLGEKCGSTPATVPRTIEVFTIDNAPAGSIQYIDDVKVWKNVANGPELFLSAEESDDGLVSVKIVDENSGAPVVGATVDIDGNFALTDALGVADINLLNATVGEKTITVSLGGYTTRAFLFDINSDDANTFNLTLLLETNGAYIDFAFKESDDATVIGNAIIQLEKVNDNNIHSRVRTNALGETTLFMIPEDGNYSFHIIRDDNTVVDYNSILVTIQPPRDEATKNQIIPVDFEVVVSNLQQRDFFNQTGAVSFFIFGNTVNNYIFSVDINTEFFDRKYFINIPGDDTTFNLQPYLVRTSTGVSTKIISRNIVDSSRIEGVTIEIYKIIAGSGLTLLETVTTDAKGEAFISGIVNDTYTFKVYFEGVEIKDSEITVTSDEIIIAFDPNPPLPPSDIEAIINVNFDPIGGKLLSLDTNLFQDVNVLNGIPSMIIIYVTQIDINNSFNDTNLVDINFTTITLPFTNTFDLNSADLNVWDRNKSIILTVVVRLTDGKETTQKVTYFAFDPIRPGDFALNFIKGGGIRILFNCPAAGPCGALIFFALVITVFLCGGVVLATPIRSPVGISVFAVILLGFFTYIDWVTVFLFVVFAFLVFAAMAAIQRVLV